jgi:hypothetical protein
MARSSGSADLPLHGGRVPACWVKATFIAGRTLCPRQFIACRNFGTVSIVGVYGGLDKIPMGSAINCGLTFRMAQTPVQHYLPQTPEAGRGGAHPM